MSAPTTKRSLDMEKDNVTPLRPHRLDEHDVEPAKGSRGKWIWLLLLLLLVVGGFIAFRLRKAAQPAQPSQTTVATPKPDAPIEITTAAAISRALPRTVEVVGSLTGDEEVVVSAQIAGEISALTVDFGSYVQQGQVIAQIDRRDAQLKLEQAEAAMKQTMARLGMKEGVKFDPISTADVQQVKAQLDWTKTDLERATKLVEAGDVPRAVYDQALTQKNLAQARYQAALDAVNQQVALVEQQQAALNLARKNLGDTVVRAPISGAVKEKTQSRGAYVPVGGKILTLVRTNPLRLRADIPETFAAAVRVGQTITLTTDAFPDRTFSGRVARIGASLNEQTRALTVEAQVANPGNQLRPGMFAKSQLVTNRNGAALMIPQKAVYTVAGINKVFVIENGKAIERIVKTGVSDGELIEITEGVNENEQVATSNADRLQQGSLVTSK
ncbi:MAG: efflux RND transporter periplasmic adaptor subunit [Acidobacteria bacterium]|nr:efflux RND transporter periplasmic adaptor subunit [Acidobacteriota bacterium]